MNLKMCKCWTVNTFSWCFCVYCKLLPDLFPTFFYFSFSSFLKIFFFFFFSFSKRHCGSLRASIFPLLIPISKVQCPPQDKSTLPPALHLEAKHCQRWGRISAWRERPELWHTLEIYREKKWVLLHFCLSQSSLQGSWEPGKVGQQGKEK